MLSGNQLTSWSRNTAAGDITFPHGPRAIRLAGHEHYPWLSSRLFVPSLFTSFPWQLSISIDSFSEWNAMKRNNQTETTGWKQKDWKRVWNAFISWCMCLPTAVGLPSKQLLKISIEKLNMLARWGWNDWSFGGTKRCSVLLGCICLISLNGPNGWEMFARNSRRIYAAGIFIF